MSPNHGWKPYRRHGLFWPVILIGIGVLFLLDNLGYLPWGVGGTIRRYWPVFLIVAGLDLLFGTPFRISRNGRQTISQPRNGATRAVINLEAGCYRLRIGALAKPDQLMEGTVTLWGSEQLTQDFRQDGTTTYANINLRGWYGFPFFFRWGSDHTLDLRINPEVELRLKINNGVGEAFLDLSQLKVTDFKLTAGVGRADVALPGVGRMEGKIDGGVGEIRIEIPKSMAARIKAETGIGSFNVNGNFLTQGKYTVSPNFETAENRVDLDIHGGVGQITVREI